MVEGMTLKVHPVFFKEFASKTWTTASGVVSELVENSFDEDATRVLVTLMGDGSIIVEDDAGMDEAALERFLTVGSPHKQEEQRSPRFGRPRSGRYGIGRLSFLTAFKRMLVKTRRGKFHSAFELDEDVLGELASGKASLRLVDEPPLGRDGTEIRLLEPRIKVDYKRLVQELRRLECLKQPLFELYLKSSMEFREWSFTGAERVTPPRVEGLHIPISEPGLEGEIIVSKRPLPEEERGLAVIVGGHMVYRSTFGLSGAAAERITGWVRGAGLTARFADKSALIEDEACREFDRRVKILLKERIIPTMNEYFEVEITRGELRVYRQVDRLLADAIHHVLELDGDGGESYEVMEAGEEREGGILETLGTTSKYTDVGSLGRTTRELIPTIPEPRRGVVVGEAPPMDPGHYEHLHGTCELPATSEKGSYGVENPPPLTPLPAKAISTTALSPSLMGDLIQRSPLKAGKGGRARRTFRLRRIGYRVVPYGDEGDDREAFAHGEFIYVNKAHPVYKAEAEKGGELLLRHVIRLVSKVIALNYHPEGVKALDLQNKLIAEAIRLRRNRPPPGGTS